MITTSSHRWIAFISILAMSVGFLVAPAYAADARSTEAKLRARHPNVEITYHDRTDVATYLYAPDGIPTIAARSSTVQPDQAARVFLDDYGVLFGIKSNSTELRTLKSTTTIDGESVVRYQQMYNNIPVVGAELNFTITTARSIESINGKVLPNVSINTTPRISRARALAIGKKSVSTQFDVAITDMTVTSADLAIFDQRIMGGNGNPTPTLVWALRLTNLEHHTPFDAYVYVNANTSAIVTQFNQIAHALSQRICDLANSRDSDDVPGNNCAADGDAVRLDSATPSGIADVDDAWEYTKATYDYFYSKFGRDGIDDAGMRMISIVRYCFNSTSNSCPYVNAFWNGQYMTYGDGFSSADDVIAHEITHGITERTAALYYYYQSGAINEAVSDIFGEFVDQYHLGSSTDTSVYKWYMGEDLPGSIGIIRYMKNPPVYGQPDRMNSRYYDSGFYSSAEWPQDNGGVHTNSGVANKAAYLMVVGGPFNGQSITRLGQSKTEQLWYRVLTTKLLSASDYADLGRALIYTCKSMANRGTAGMTTANCTNVQKTVTATQMTNTPSSAPAVNSPICTGGKVVTNTFYDNMESFPTTWLPAGSSWYYDEYATSGSYSAVAYTTRYRHQLTLTQRRSVLVPANAYLHFNHAYEFASQGLKDGTDIVYYHGGIVEYSINNGSTWSNLGSKFINQGYNGTIVSDTLNPLKGKRAFVGVSYGFKSSRASLSAFAGKRIKLRFRYATDSMADPWTGWWIDDVRIYTCK